MKRYNLLVWKINDAIDQNPSYQIQEFIIEKIKSNEIKHGDRLLSQREFSKLNHINSNTVKRAYANLAAIGWVTSVIGSGTFVSKHLHQKEVDFTHTGFPAKLPVKIEPLNVEPFKFLSVKQNFMAVGLDVLNPSFYPERVMFKYLRYHRKRYENMSQMQQVTDLHGLDFKEAIKDYLNGLRGFRLNPGSLEVIIGRKESLCRIFQMLLSSGGMVVNTASQDIVLSSALIDLNAEVHSMSTVVEQDFIEALEALLSKTKIKALYVSPQCGYPEGNVLSEDTCLHLLELAKMHGFYIVEEDNYHEFWYNRVPYKSLGAYDHNGHVIYTGCLSQLSIYMQNTRVVAASKAFIDLLAAVPTVPPSFKNLVEERAIMEMLNSGELYQLAKQARIAKERDRDNLVWGLNNYLGQYMNIPVPESGLSLWLKFPDYLNLMEAMGFLEEQDLDVPFNPGQPSNPNRVYHMRLGFGTLSMEEAQQGAKLLAKKFEEYNS